MITGAKMDVYGEEQPVDIFADFICLNNDSPAACKFSGLVGVQEWVMMPAPAFGAMQAFWISTESRDMT